MSPKAQHGNRDNLLLDSISLLLCLFSKYLTRKLGFEYACWNLVSPASSGFQCRKS